MFTSLRLKIYKYLVYALLFTLILVLFKLQIIDGKYYKKRSEDNIIRLVPIHAVRGRIFDRNGKLLADNKPSFDFYIIPADFDFQYSGLLCKILKIDEDFAKNDGKSGRESPVLVKRDLTCEEVQKISELSDFVGGIIISVSGKRYYPYEDAAAHVIGYIGRINKKEYDEKKIYGYMIDDYVGRYGIEYMFDDILHGISGGRQIEVDARGNMIRVLAERKPVMGMDVNLTIDIELQKKIQGLFDKGEKGAVCMMNVKTGEILVLASAPSFDPNVFVTPSMSGKRLELLNDKELPFLNRAVSASYPPGSVFKIVTALAALEKGIITPYTKFECKGKYYLTPRSRPYHCWLKTGHGSISLADALKQSCNIYFYKVGKRLGVDNLYEFAKRISLDEPLLLELPNVKRGLLPSREWKKKHFKEKWYQGETLNYSIGQGFLSVTPMQVLKILSLFATGGKIVEPTLIKGVKHSPKKLPIKRKNIEAVKIGMLKAVNDAYGTAKLASVDFFKVAGKTGTAQANGEPHAWFAGFFPYRAPEIAIVVLIEHGGIGGRRAAFISNKAVTYWYELYGKGRAK